MNPNKPVPHTEDRPRRLGASALAAIALGATALLGCASTPYSYGSLRSSENIERLLKATSAYEAGPDQVFMELPRMKAQFCLERAAEAYAASKRNLALDYLMLTGAGLGAGVGTSMGAASSAMNDKDGSRKDIAIVSVTTLAAAGALLGLRAALNLNEVARTERVAAARDVNAAISILEKYALADDPKDVGEDGFVTCRDEDVNIANAFPGSKAVEPIEKVLSKSKEEKAEKEKVASVAASTEADAKAAAKGNRQKVADLEKKLQKPPTAGQRNGGASKDPQVAETERELEKAKEAQPELDAKAKEAEEKAKIEAARAQVAGAQVDVNEKKGSVVAAAAQVRRAVFYLTKDDVELAQGLLKGSLAALESSRASLKAAQKRLDDALSPPAAAAAAPSGGTTTPTPP